VQEAVHRQVGTIFEDSNVKLNLWVQAVRAHDAEQEGHQRPPAAPHAEVTYKTAWFMEHRIREAMRSGDLAPSALGGGVVEIDETFIGKDPKWVALRQARASAAVSRR
jgi:hypothetical protein